MVDLEAGQTVRGHRVDAVAAAAIVLTVDAVLFLVVAVIGVPFLMFVFGDEEGTWARLWPYAAAWLVAVVLAAVCTATVLRLSGFGSYSVRRAGTAAALGTAVAAAVLAAASIRSTPSLVLIALPFAVANLAAALVLAGPERASAVAERFTIFRPALEETPVPPDEPEPAPVDESVYERPAEPDEPVRTHDTIDLLAHGARPRPSVSPRRSRGPAALRTHAGIQLPRRARRPRAGQSTRKS
ncbi:hypothetical protein KOI35_18120 [Actinoplanes bogorensis]|uniref:Uncharacterized protein n=1 Tax=Paractinoplanes bogorensis TaxID=1610840 RepID=A0ABS5YPP1_9ACTN|nr:hypothetical protein [Actinoplanes bogorensis]MBU2665427.1 hypothetical protein [Actinoplanes bogorensis]